MRNKISIHSRFSMEKLIESGFPENTAVISFYDPKSNRSTRIKNDPVDYSGVCERVFYVAVYDMDIESLDEYGLSLETYLPDANDLAAFISSSVHDGCNIICQCDYGQSRSAGCAAAIKEYYDRAGIEVFADYRYYPNQIIFNKVLAALKALHRP